MTELFVVLDPLNDIIFEHIWNVRDSYDVHTLRLLLYSSIDLIEEYRNGIIDYHLEYNVSLYIMNSGYKFLFANKWLQPMALDSFLKHGHRIFKKMILKPRAPQHLDWIKFKKEIIIEYNRFHTE